MTQKLSIVTLMFCLGVLAGCSSQNSATKTGTPTLVSIQLSLGQSSVAAGLPDQVTATGTYSNNTTQNLTGTATLTSSDNTVASVSSSGVVTTKTQGTAKITASLSGVSGSVTLTVGAPAITSLSLSSAGASIARGTTMQFSANGTLTNGSTENVTSLVTWTSSNPAVASINVNGAAGLAMGLTAGTSTITATSGSVSQSALLTVTAATVTSISVTPLSAAIPLGTVQQFSASGTFSDNTVQDITGTVAWTSSAPAVASITVSGLVTAKDLGTATITATFGSITGTASATVNAADLSSITVLPATQTIAQNTTQQFSATGTFNDGSTHNLTADVAWSSLNSAVAPIGAATGLAKGLAPGSATITATLGSVSGSTTLDVSNAGVTSISVSPTGRTMAPATELAFTATGTFNGPPDTEVITTDVVWASDNTAVATVGPAGVVTAVAPGTANISAAFGGVTGSAAVTVSSVTLQSIAINPASAVLVPASTLSYSATGTFSDGSTANLADAVSWSSSATNVASINNDGQVTGQSAGTATITAQLGSVVGTAALAVASGSLSQIVITPADATVAEQTGTQFTATGVFQGGSSQNLTSSVSWTSSPASIATISNAAPSKGLASGISPGTATITALFAGLSSSVPLSVTNATLTSITVTPADASIASGNTEQFTATGNFSDGSTEILTTQVAWSSSKVGVATVTSYGLASTVGSGSTTITATMNGVSGSTTLTVN